MNEGNKKLGSEGNAAPPQALQPCSPGLPVEAEEDEINLLDLFIVLLKHKVMILTVVILTGIAAVTASLLMTKIYRSEATIVPTGQDQGAGALSALGGFGALIASEAGIGGSGSLEQFDVVLKSRELTNIIVQQHNLLPILFEDDWDAEAKRWKEEPPKLEDIQKAVENIFSISADKKKNVMRLSVEDKDPKMAQTILNYYIVGLSEFMRRQTLTDAAAQREHLLQQLANTTDPLLKNRLYELVAKQIEKETLAKVQKYYSFDVIDPAFVPEKKYRPKRALICVLSVTVAFFFAVFLAFFLEYIQNLTRNEDPERLAGLRRALRWRRG
jgi:uncharacterized protein involved in exopolysaccharide biosynthesis